MQKSVKVILKDSLTTPLTVVMGLLKALQGEHIYIYAYIYDLYLYIYRERERETNYMHTQAYIHICICTRVYIYVEQHIDIYFCFVGTKHKETTKQLDIYI